MISKLTNISSSLRDLSSTYDISLEPLCKAHLQQLAVHLREEDRRELWACYRLGTMEALTQCAARSLWAIALLHRGEVCAVAGIEPSNLLGRHACVWSWTGDGVNCCRKSFMRVSHRVIGIFQKMYPHLYAACDIRYRAASRYLVCLGAVPTGKEFYLAGKETKFALYQWQ